MGCGLTAMLSTASYDDVDCGARKTEAAATSSATTKVPTTMPARSTSIRQYSRSSNSVSPVPEYHRRQGSQEDLHVEAQRPVLNVPDVEQCHLVEWQVAPPGYLP